MSVDLTSVLVAIIGGVFSIVGTVFSIWLASHMKDQAAAATISNAVKNSLGAIQQAAQTGVVAIDPRVTVPGVTPVMGAGIQYVLDHAGDEAERLGITQDAIVSKITAQIGLSNISHNLAVTAGPTPASPAPLSVV